MEEKAIGMGGWGKRWMACRVGEMEGEGRVPSTRKEPSDDLRLTYTIL